MDTISFIFAGFMTFAGLIIAVRILTKVIVKTFFEEKNKQKDKGEFNG